MLASAVGIDRLLVRDVWRLIGRDDRARKLGLHVSGNTVRNLLKRPAVVDSGHTGRGESVGRIGQRAPSLEVISHAGTVHPYSYRSKPRGRLRRRGTSYMR